MKDVSFDRYWRAVLAKVGIESFDDIFNYSDGKIINKNRKRSVQRIELSSDGGRYVLFVKRFFKPHFKDIVSSLVNFGWIYSQGEIEWRNANFLIENGIEAYYPVCCGSERVLGIHGKSFFMTSELQSTCFADFVAEKWLKLEDAEKKHIMSGLGQMIRRIHDVKVSLPDLYVWHVYIKERRSGVDEDKYEFAVIDLHRMDRNVGSLNRRIKNLGRFDHSMIDKYFTAADRRSLIEGYAGYDWNGGVECLKAKVEKYSKAVSGMREPKEY